MSLGTTPCTQVQQHIMIWHPGMTEYSQQYDPNPELLVVGGGEKKREKTKNGMVNDFFTKGPLKQNSICSVTKAYHCP